MNSKKMKGINVFIVMVFSFVSCLGLIHGADAVAIESQDVVNRDATTSVDSIGISTEGDVISYDSSKNPFHPKLVIPESKEGITIKGIAAGGLKEKGLTEVVLPNTIQNIGKNAFEENAITKVTFPTGDFEVGEYAFRNNAFTEVRIPSNMKLKVGNFTRDGVFEGNANLVSVTFDEGITTVPSSTFKGCTSLKNVTLSSTIDSIGSYAFNNTKIENIMLPESLKTIGSSAFYSSNLTSIIIPNSVTEIFDSAFSGNLLQTVVLSNQLTTMGVQCFQGNKIIEIEIPASLKRIPNMAFFKNEIEKVTFHTGLETIGSQAFMSNKIQSVDIPKGMKTIGSYAFMSNKLKDVHFSGSVKSIETATFANNEIERITISEGTETIKKQAFANNQIGSLQLPSTLTEIGAQSFSSNRLAYVELPSALTTIATDSFQLQSSVPTEYVVRAGKYIYQLPNGVDETKITEVKGKSNGVAKDIQLDGSKKKFISNELLTEINYIITLENTTVSTSMNVKMKPQIKKHHVIMKDFDNTILAEYDIDDTQSIENAPVLSRAGYTFIGWDKPLNNITENQTVRAQYKQLPQISVEDKRITMGSSFNPLKDVSATDADGNKLNDVSVIENTVNIEKVGTYSVTVEVTDQWGGTSTKQYQVIVENKYTDKVLPDESSGITIDGAFTDNAKLVVELTPIPAPSLSDKIVDKDLINAFEVHVVGEYYGKLKIRFPLDKKLNGIMIYIYHEKSDGTIEAFQSIANNGFVEIIVDELSPFVLAKEKGQQTGNVTPSDTSDHTVQSGDQTNVVGLTMLATISGFIVFIIAKKSVLN